MGSRSGRYLEQASRYPQRAWEQAEGWISHSPPPKKPAAAQVAGLAVLAIGVMAGIYFGADLLRYMQMRRM